MSFQREQLPGAVKRRRAAPLTYRSVVRPFENTFNRPGDHHDSN
jgi:hypothetical protein